MKSFWEKVHTRGAHLGLDGEVPSMRERYARLLKAIPLRGQAVIDFGCGGGLLGEFLFEKRGISRYVAYDVAKRSIEHARARIAPWGDRAQLILLEKHRWDFAAQKPDVLVCLACIMHFPSKTYLDNFLRTCDESGAKYLVLEVRYDAATRFQQDPYSSEKAAVKACFTNEPYVSALLPHYKPVLEDKDGSTRIIRYIRKEMTD